MSTADLSTTAAAGSVTAETLLRDYGEQSCELIEGKLRMMSPAGFGHGAIAQRVATALAQHAEPQGLGIVAGAETGFLIGSDPDTVLAPDVAFVKQARLEAVGVTNKYFPEAPALAVEIVSPNDTAEQVDDKTRRWLAAGCEMVWVVYPKGRSVTVYRSLEDVRIVTGDTPLEGADVVTGFAHPVSELFAGLDPR
ncbi:hypothetical protein Mal64_15640 [Pseudobythopirellula maris]|uniref:Putative restriction endonuclease domain-containing protein n=1 Tax=Pseudobythopirellula maris TaxID=2527991 RepID=A0A5C5ZKY3_9BACT|nr:Uma2 family endonuclease [Pseudobythopirellula maris]TWT88092.1 hypothetical protein Mal64_15640 [Pseudobythopirellula maris]